MSAFTPCTVLVVDDDPAVREIYRLALERAGHRVVVAADGMAGLDMVSTASPDLVLLDIRMPKLDGIELLRRIASDPATKGIPVVMLSNYDDPNLVKQSLDLGAKEHMVKVDVDPRRLPDLVQKWVQRDRTGSPSSASA